LFQGAAAAWEHHSRASREQSASTIVPICESLQNKSNAARDIIERELSAFQRGPDNRLYMMAAFSKVMHFILKISQGDQGNELSLEICL